MKKDVLKKGLYLAVPFIIGLSFLLISFDALAFDPADCISPKVRISKMMNLCWICDFTAILLNAINTVVTDGYTILSAPGTSLSILAVGLALWLCWKCGNYFLNYKYADPRELMNEVGYCFLRCIIISSVLLFGTVSFVFDTLIYPVIAGFMDLIMAIIGLDINVVDLGSKTNYCKLAGSVDDLGVNGMAFSKQFMSGLVCMVQASYFEVVKGMAIGLGINCESYGHGFNLVIDFPDFSMWMIGGFIFILFFLISICYSFKVIDFFVHMAFAFVLLPLLMVAWVFPITRQYTKKAWDLFLYSLFGLLAVAMTLPIIIAMCGEVLGGSGEIDKYLNNNNMTDLYNYVYKAGTNWLLFFAVAFISILLLKTCTAIAGQFVQVSGGVQNNNIGDAVGAKMVQTALQTVQAAVRVAKLAAASTGVGAVAGAAASGAKARLKKGVKKAASGVKNAGHKAVAHAKYNASVKSNSSSGKKDSDGEAKK